MAEIRVGDITIETDTLPEASVRALVTKGLRVTLGNEVASAVAGWVKRQDTPPDEKTIAKETQRVRDRKVASIKDGTMTTRGPRDGFDPVEAEIERLAEAAIDAAITARGIRVTRARRAELAEAYAEAHYESLREQAEKALARASRNVSDAALALLDAPAA